MPLAVRRRGWVLLLVGSVPALCWAIRPRPELTSPSIAARSAPPPRKPPRFVVAAARAPSPVLVARAAAPSPPPAWVFDPIDLATGEPVPREPAPAPAPGPPDPREGFLDQLLARELPDQAWADRISEALRVRFAETPGVAIARVTCAAKLCRLELASVAGTDQILDHLPGVAEAGAEMMVQGFPEAPVPKVIAYLSREGDLPVEPQR